MPDENRDLEITVIMGDVVDYGQARSGAQYALITLSHHEMCIHDPRMDDSGRDPVDPSYYGMSPDEVERFILANEALIESQNLLQDKLSGFVDDACARIQTTLGAESGDLAAHMFSDSSATDQLSLTMGQQLAQYALTEYWKAVERSDESPSASPRG